MRRMVTTPPDHPRPGPAPLVPAGVLSAFGLAGPARRLSGGGGTSVEVGTAVLKPVDDPLEAEWVAATLARVSGRGFRLPTPLTGPAGTHVVDGWAAATLVAGQTGPTGHWAELLGASRAFHAALAHLPRPAHLEARTSRWALGDRVAWEAARPPVVVDELVSPLEHLVGLLAPVRSPSQVVHGDLAGNVLFAPGLEPAIIDFSPYWRPVAWAEAVAMVDGMLWYGGGPELEALAGELDEAPQMLARAAIFRLVALNERCVASGPSPEELGWFAPVIELVTTLAHRPHRATSLRPKPAPPATASIDPTMADATEARPGALASLCQAATTLLSPSALGGDEPSLAPAVRTA